MTAYRLGQAARLLGVSVDTVRRLVDSGRLESVRTSGQQRLVDGVELAKLACELDTGPGEHGSSARNHLLGIVTHVKKDTVAAQVELRCGPFRIVSLLTRESVDALGLAPGVIAYAVVKATNVVVELAAEPGVARPSDAATQAGS
ncbi:MAG TPA: TOBE domain-containing protein [Planctomycetota bacterium]|nr:TOBE domain-containing protein [Planctomycetota bacterium]